MNQAFRDGFEKVAGKIDGFILGALKDRKVKLIAQDVANAKSPVVDGYVGKLNKFKEDLRQRAIDVHTKNIKKVAFLWANAPKYKDELKFIKILSDNPRKRSLALARQNVREGMMMSGEPYVAPWQRKRT